ncbi:hypothetical protein L218DRAFT_185446 [Marasmius fiardii PR-910]|nr:hypothetical protein L218DRAFT_185446 [Marasmius fiardii PR-910]
MPKRRECKSKAGSATGHRNNGIKTILIDNVDEPVANKIIAYRNRFTVLSLSQPVMFFCEVVIGDYIVVWRAWVLWTENRRVVYPSVFLLLGSAASVISFLGCLVHFDWPLDLPPTCRALSISNYVLSIATNVLATAAIGYKVWIYRRVLREYLGTGGRPTATQKTLFLLLESGIVYTFLWFLQLFVVTSINELFQQASLSLSVQLVGIYPTLIIVLVYLQRSLWDPSGAPSLHLSNSTESVILASGTDVQLDNPRASYPRTARMLDDSPIGIPPTCGYQSHPNRSSHCSANPEVLANTHAGIPSKQLVPTAECAIVN